MLSSLSATNNTLGSAVSNMLNGFMNNGFGCGGFPGFPGGMGCGMPGFPSMGGGCCNSGCCSTPPILPTPLPQCCPPGCGPLGCCGIPGADQTCPQCCDPCRTGFCVRNFRIISPNGQECSFPVQMPWWCCGPTGAAASAPLEEAAPAAPVAPLQVVDVVAEPPPPPPPSPPPEEPAVRDGCMSASQLFSSDI